MQPDATNPDDPSADQIPDALREDLVRAFNRVPDIGQDIDARILLDAKSSFDRRMRFRPFLRRAGLVGSIAAVLAVTFTLVSVWHRSPPRLAQAGDINHDGRVDILDAMLVARALAEGTKLEPAWDVNHDGVVDQKDVDWIATTAVNVSGAGGRQ